MSGEDSDNQIAERSPFRNIPPEIILEISTQLGLVSTKGLSCFRQTCRCFRDLTATYETSVVRDVMAHYPPDALERLDLCLSRPSYPSMYRIIRRFATMSWIMSGVSYSITLKCKAQPKPALARFEEGLKLMYTLSDDTSHQSKIDKLYKMPIASLVSLWLALYYCTEEACDQGKGFIDGDYRKSDTAFRLRVEAAFCEEALWQGPTFVYDTLRCADRADVALQTRLDSGGEDAGVYNELVDWLSGALGCERDRLVYEAFYGMR